MMIDCIYTALFYLKILKVFHSEGVEFTNHHQCVTPSCLMHSSHFAPEHSTHQLEVESATPFPPKLAGRHGFFKCGSACL